ncbi:hypothetical protein NKI46_25200 [Mesorhizobium sp. M0615]
MLEFLLSPGQPILSTLQGGNGGLKALAVQRLIFKPLRDSLVDDIEAVEAIGSLFQYARSRASRSAPAMFFGLATARIFWCRRARPIGANQTLFATEQHERGVGRDDRVRIVMAESGNGPIIWPHASSRACSRAPDAAMIGSD